MNKKGFTLIELLAVILILGIIALIAIPAVNDVINDSKLHAEEATINHIIKAYEDYYQLKTLKEETIVSNALTLADTETIANEIGITGDIHTKDAYVSFELDNTGNAYVKYNVGGIFCTNLSGEGNAKSVWSKGVCANTNYPTSATSSN